MRHPRADFTANGSNTLPGTYWIGVYRMNNGAPYVYVDGKPLPQVRLHASYSRVFWNGGNDALSSTTITA